MNMPFSRFGLSHKATRFFGGFVCLSLLTSMLAGCSTLPKTTPHAPEPESSSAQVKDVAKPTSFALSYNENDTMNPYTCKTSVNLDLMTLVFDGLTGVNADFTSCNVLAQSVSIDGMTATAVIRSDAVFSNGAKVTPEAIIASYIAAKSSSYYKELVLPITSISKAGDNAVHISFSALCPVWQNALSFPIVSNPKAKTPLGAGKYVFSENNGSEYLKANSHKSPQPTHSQLRLQSVANNAAIRHALESGSVSSYYTDLSDGEIPRISSSSTQLPTMNYLVFVGINSSKTGLKEPAVRQALGEAVNRTELVSSGYLGRADAALTPFCPSWAGAKDLTGFTVKQKSSEAIARLKQAGYNNSDGASPVKQLSLELLVNKENAFRKTASDYLRQEFADIGVTLKVTELSFKDYESRISKSNFDLYLGEIKLSTHLSLNAFFTPTGAASKGISADKTKAAYFKFVNEGGSAQEFMDAFLEEVPFIPVCYRKGIFAYHRALTGVSPVPFDIYNAIDKWKIS